MKVLLSLLAVGFLASCAGKGHHSSGDCCGGHSKKERGSMMCSKQGHDHGKHKGHKMMMENLDTNKDGKISKAEFEKKHENKFSKMDKNSDGFLTQDEMGEGCGCPMCAKGKKEKPKK